MTVKRSPPAQLPADGGELATYSKFRDRVTLALAAGVLTLMGYFVHEAQDQAAQAKHDAAVQVEGLRTEIRELRDRLNGELTSTAAFQSQQVTTGSEVVRRLNLIETKLDTLSAMSFTAAKKDP